MVTLTDITAMRLWAIEGLADQVGDPVAASGCAWSLGSMRDLDELEVLEKLLEDGPIHILVSSASERPKSERVVAHVWSSRVPPGSLHQLAPGILIASPAFCFLQAAGRYGAVRATAVAMEVMGLYGRVKSPRGFVDRQPLATKEFLAQYLEGAKGSYGARAARKALGWSLERSRSPMETKSVLIFTLPGAVGGYGLPRPMLNYRIIFDADELAYAQFPWYEADACWPDRRTIYEYNSYSDHLSMEALDRDAMKLNTLRILGWKTSVVTSGQLSGHSLDVLARQLARDLGVECREPDPKMRDKLIEELG